MFLIQCNNPSTTKISSSPWLDYLEISTSKLQSTIGKDNNAAKMQEMGKSFMAFLSCPDDFMW